MPNRPIIINPLRRDGTSQPSRFPQALDPRSAPIDEKEMPDFLVFAAGFARQIQYWGQDNVENGDWLAFVERDPSVVLALLGSRQLQLYRDSFHTIHADLEQAITSSASSGVINGLFEDLLDLLKSSSLQFGAGPDFQNAMLWELDHWAIRLRPDTGMDSFVSGLIRADVLPRLQTLMRVHYELDETYGGLTFSMSSYAGLSAVWGDLSAWFTANVLTGYTPHFFVGATAEIQLLGALRGLRVVFDAFFNALSVLVAAAPGYLQRSLADQDAHAPQMALYLAFIELFKNAQNHLNGFTQRHLDHYYKEVLRMQPSIGQASIAHVNFQLRANVSEFLLPKGTLLDGGKDAAGQPRRFATQDELVINPASVTSLRSLFFAPTQTQEAIYPPKGAQVYAASKANSADGKGAALPKGNPKWQLLGGDQKGKSAAARTMEDASMGFAIASPELYLSGGKRFARFFFLLDNNNALKGLSRRKQVSLESAIVSSARVQLTAEKSWYETGISRAMLLTGDASLSAIDDLSLMIASNLGEKKYKHFSLLEELAGIDFSITNVLLIEVELDADAPAILPYKAEVHGGSYASPHPVAVFRFDNRGLSAGKDNIGEMPYAAVGVPPYWWQFQGNFYKRILGTPYRKKTVKDYLATRYGEFDEEKTYTAGNRVLFDGLVYRSLRGSGSPAPDSSPDFWLDLIGAPPVPMDPDYDPLAVYEVGDRVIYNGRLYEALRNSNSPFPNRSIGWWAQEDFTINLYSILHTLNPKKLLLKITVEGLTPSKLENDAGPLNPAKPFSPFGFRPELGAKFYIGSGEAFGKKLSQLDVQLEWLDPPSDFALRYAEYASGMTVPNNPDFVAKPTIKYRGEWLALRPGNLPTVPLFDAVDAKLPHGFSVDFTSALVDQALDQAGYHRAEQALTALEEAAKAHRGFLRLEFNGPAAGFGHRAFSDVYTKQVIANTGILPQEPYTPTLKSLQLNYRSEATIELSGRSMAAYQQRIDRFYHLHPFGVGEVHPAFLSENSTMSLLPRYVEQGALLIGVADLQTPRSLTLHFQLAEGSSNPDLPRGSVRWQYLSGNQWLDLAQVRLVQDSTLGMRRSGIVVLDLPANADTAHTILPDGLHWLKLSVLDNAAAVDHAIDVIAQAVAVRQVDFNADSAHDFPAETIVGLLSPRSAIQAVRQPFASQGGRKRDDNVSFWTRVSERLRHKARSSNVWDYERMVLEQFPEIYKAKCINHMGEDCEIAPGNVTVVTIPDLRNRNAVNIFEPRTSLELLDRIHDYLRYTVTPTLRLHVRNPLYEIVRARCAVSFHPGYDAGYYSRQLMEDIQRFLSPWAFEEGKDIVFGGRIHRSFILNFIEERPYVDFVVAFKMDHIVDGVVALDVQEARTTTSRSILVSATDHLIRPLVLGEFACTGSPYYDGIDYWIIDSDFIVQ